MVSSQGGVPASDTANNARRGSLTTRLRPAWPRRAASSQSAVARLTTSPASPPPSTNALPAASRPSTASAFVQPLHGLGTSRLRPGRPGGSPRTARATRASAWARARPPDGRWPSACASGARSPSASSFWHGVGALGVRAGLRGPRPGAAGCQARRRRRRPMTPGRPRTRPGQDHVAGALDVGCRTCPRGPWRRALPHLGGQVVEQVDPLQAPGASAVVAGRPRYGRGGPRCAGPPLQRQGPARHRTDLGRPRGRRASAVSSSAPDVPGRPR